MKQKIIKFFLVGSMVGCLLAENLYAQDEDNKKLSNDNQNFYRVIVENNLFRALGWRKPKRESDYVLIGTLIEQNGKVAKAFVMEQRSSRYYSVSVGGKIGKCADIIAQYRRSIGKLIPRQLHAVARIAGKADDHRLARFHSCLILFLLRCRRRGRCIGHL